jgi:hypothetical protein
LRNECKSKTEIDLLLKGISFYINTKENFLDFSNYENPYNKYIKDQGLDRPGSINLITTISFRNLDIISDTGLILEEY